MSDKVEDCELLALVMSSSWEKQAAACEEHRKALKAYEEALFRQMEVDEEVAVARVALERAEGRVSK
jgi:uncharacterized protein